MQLLDAYASPDQVPTNLIGDIGVGGCCPTWLALAGTWASSLQYGVSIMTVYQQMLAWVIPQRLMAAAIAGTAPAGAGPRPDASRHADGRDGRGRRDSGTERHRRGWGGRRRLAAGSAGPGRPRREAGTSTAADHYRWPRLNVTIQERPPGTQPRRHGYRVRRPAPEDGRVRAPPVTTRRLWYQNQL